jgi:hypothetical protein
VGFWEVEGCSPARTGSNVEWDYSVEKRTAGHLQQYLVAQEEDDAGSLL